MDSRTRTAQPSKKTPEKGSRLRVMIVGEGVYLSRALPDQGRVSIGRSEQADIMVPHDSLSRTHAFLQLGSKITIEDGGSKNGTYVQGKAVQASHPVEIEPGEPVEIGELQLIVQRLDRGRTRKLFSHDYFEERIDEECQHRRTSGERFSVLRFVLRGIPQNVERVFAPLDLVAFYGPGEYEALVLRNADEARSLAEAVVGELSAEGVDATFGLSSFPRDGHSAEVLIGRAATSKRNSADSVLVDPAMKALYKTVEQVARSSVSVIILGETGAGKEVLAERIHTQSPRAKGPFVTLNCGAFPEALIESELFGHERGAFSGAAQRKLGLIETADKGTLFLDEVGELPHATQVKLLRVLEERKVRRLGATAAHSVDVRLVSATNRDLDAEIEAGRFRADLFFRLNGILLTIPPLRDRPLEVEPLAAYFIGRWCEREGRPLVPRLSPEAIAVMQSYSWPGNVRELRNLVERAALLCTGAEIGAEHFPTERMRGKAKVGWSEAAKTARAPDQSLSHEIDQHVAELERQRIVEALDACDGNQTKASKMLGISLRTLVSRMGQFNLPRPRKKI